MVVPPLKVLVPESVTVPPPVMVTVPVPPIALAAVLVSLRSKTRRPSSVTGPVPRLPPLSIWSVPALRIVPPV